MRVITHRDIVKLKDDMTMLLEIFTHKCLKIKKKKRCGHCNSTRIKRGYYSRGWNNALSQASGDEGWMCDNCIKVSWEQTVEKAVKNAPSWCTVYEKSTTLVKNL